MINSNIITFDEHIKWVKYVKHQNNLEIFVIFDNNKKLLEPLQFQISINLIRVAIGLFS